MNSTAPSWVCPVCDGARFELLYRNAGGFFSFNGHPADFQICVACGLVFRWPRPSEGDIARMYASAYYGGRSSPNKPFALDKLFRESQKNVAWAETIMGVIDEEWSDGCVVDVGCGFGSWVATLADVLPNCSVIGIEPDREIARALKVARSRDNVTVECGTLETFVPPCARPIRAVFLMTVFEHLYNPLGALRKLRSIMNKGAWLVINVPNVMRPSPLGLDYFFKDFHLFYYSDRTLTALLQKSGFNVREVIHDFEYASGARTLCVVARRDSECSITVRKNEGEAKRIRARVIEARSQTRVAGPARLLWNYKVRRPVLHFRGQLHRTVNRGLKSVQNAWKRRYE